MNKRQLLELLDYCEDEDKIFTCDNKQKLNTFFYNGKDIIIGSYPKMGKDKVWVSKPFCGLSEDSLCGNRDKKDFICNKTGKCGYQDWEKRFSKEENLK